MIELEGLFKEQDINSDGNVEYVTKAYPYTTLMTWEFIKHKHKHSFWEMVICIKGSANHYINEVKYSVKACDIIIMKPDNTHNYKIIDGSDNAQNGSYAHYDFYSTGNDMKNACDSLSKGFYEKIANDKNPVCFSVDILTLNMIESKLSQLNSLQISSQFQSISQTVYNTLLHLFCGLMLENVALQSSNIPDWLSKLLSEMSRPEVLCGKVSDLVNISGFSHGHLCKLFKKHTGQSLIEYFTKLKIDYGTVLLKNKNLNILDIATILGYDSLSHFIQIFKKFNGTTPKQYRNLLYNQT